MKKIYLLFTILTTAFLGLVFTSPIYAWDQYSDNYLQAEVIYTATGQLTFESYSNQYQLLNQSATSYIPLGDPSNTQVLVLYSFKVSTMSVNTSAYIDVTSVLVEINWTSPLYLPSFELHIYDLNNKLIDSVSFENVSELNNTVIDFQQQNLEAIGYNQGYNVGLNEGYNNAKEEYGYWDDVLGIYVSADYAYDEGYNVGLNADFDYFAWMRTALWLPAQILAIEIWPGFQLGYFAFFTLFMGMIGFIFRLFGKGGK